MESTPDRPGSTDRTEATPHRRPAHPPQGTERPRPTGPMIAALVTVAVLVLTVGIGGSILVYRALAPEETSGQESHSPSLLIGADPVAAHVDLSSNTQAGSGTLPLGG